MTATAQRTARFLADTKDSTLYYFAPVNPGSTGIECFTSYLSRLAVEHNLRLRTIIGKVIIPHLRKSSTYSSSPSGYGQLTTTWWSTCSPPLNGLTASTREWVEVIEQLTLRENLSCLTMLPWANVLPFRGLLRREKAWCSSCYEDARQSRGIIYDRLPWTLEAVQICPYHKRKLETRCPFDDCGCLQTILAPESQPGFCQKCNRWLGYSAQLEQQIDGTAQNLQEQLQHTEWIAQMLAAGADMQVLPRRDSIAMAIDCYVRENCDGNVSEFGRRLGINKRTALELHQGTQLPQLHTLLKICRLLGTSPLDLLTEKTAVKSSSSERIVVDSLQRAPKPLRPFNKESLQTFLESVLQSTDSPPLPMDEIAKQLAYDASHLHKHFSPLCSAISARFLQYRANQKAIRINNICQRVKQAVYDLHNSGMDPSKHQVGKIIRVPLMLEPQIHNAYLEALSELGYSADQ